MNLPQKLPLLKLSLCVTAIALTGCQTPPDVYELAEKTSANSAIFQQHLGEVAQRSRSLAERRAQQVAQMDAFNATLDAFIKRELYMREKASSASEWARTSALMSELTTLRDGLINLENASVFAEQDRRNAIMATHADLNTFKKSMLEVANALNALAQKEDGVDRARFMAKLLSQLVKDARAGLSKSDDASQAAKALIDQIKSSLNTEEQTTNN